MNRSFNTARAAVLAGLMTGCIIWSAAAFAADYDAIPQGAIAVHAGDFTSPRMVARIRHRLDRVARDICFGQSGDERMVSPSERACYDTALKSGLTQIDSRERQALRDRTIRLADSGTRYSVAR